MSPCSHHRKPRPAFPSWGSRHRRNRPTSRLEVSNQQRARLLQCMLSRYRQLCHLHLWGKITLPRSRLCRGLEADLYARDRTSITNNSIFPAFWITRARLIHAASTGKYLAIAPRMLRSSTMAYRRCRAKSIMLASDLARRKSTSRGCCYSGSLRVTFCWFYFWFSAAFCLSLDVEFRAWFTDLKMS